MQNRRKQRTVQNTEIQILRTHKEGNCWSKKSTFPGNFQSSYKVIYYNTTALTTRPVNGSILIYMHKSLKAESVNNQESCK